jgi:predicted dehydrogenase
VQELKQAIVPGKLGRVQDIRIGACWPRLDHYYGRNAAAGKMSVRGEPVFDGPATNALAHLIHNAMFLAGAQADEFDAPVEITAELYRARPIESYDVACLRGKFRSGITFSAALTHATEETLPYCTDVRGSDGWARVSQDGTVIESSFPCLVDCRETFEQLVAKTHRDFLAFALGERPRPLTSLLDTRGYVLATNGMLLSSGGIHPVAAKHLRPYTRGEEGGYDVAGLYDAVTTSCQTGKLFSELDLPWTVGTSPVSVENLKSLAFSG